MKLTQSVKRALLLCAIAVSLVLLYWVALRSYSLPPADLSATAKLLDTKGWHPIVNVESNAFHEWRIDPLLVRLQSLFDSNLHSPGMPARTLHLAIFFLGLVVFFFSLGASATGVGVALMIPALFLYLFGPDSVIFGSLTWSGWYLWSVRQCLLALKKKGLWTLLSFALACRIALSANQLACLVLVILLWFTALLHDTDLVEQHKKMYLRFLGAISLLPALFVLFTAPIPHFPNYPAFARVVPDDGLPGIILPLTGAHASLQVIDHWAVRAALGTPALIALGLALVAFLLSKRDRVWVPALLLFVITSLDTCLPESWVQVAPLATIGRILAGHFLFALAPLAFALGCVSFSTALINDWNRLPHAASIVLPLALIFGTGSLRTSPLLAKDLPSKLAHVSYLLAHPQLVSPSWYVYRHFNFSPATDKIEQSVRHTPGFSELTVEASAQNEAIIFGQMLDDKRDTRWSPNAGRQDGSEWVRYNFFKPMIIRGIELSTGTFVTDFPRGLRITASTQCDGSGPILPASQRLFEQRSWQGPLRFTNDGFPYFGGEHIVEAIFDAPTSVGCLVVAQIGHEPHFDWSIAEMSLFLNSTVR